MSETSHVRDTAGIGLITYQRLFAAQVSFRVEAKPYLELGGLADDNRHELDARNPSLGAVELGNGNIVVNETSRLKFFSPTGEFVRAVGRAGNGPGEFLQIREVCRVHGDTLLVIDYADGRVTLWDSAGSHVRTYSRPGFIPYGGCLHDGSVIVRTESSASAASRSPTFEHQIRRLDGTVVGSIGPIAAPQYAGPIISEPSVVPMDSFVVVAESREYEIQVRTRTGELRRISRVSGARRILTDDEWRRQVEAMVPSNATTTQRSRILARFLKAKPTHLPPYRRIHADEAGRVWIEDYDNPASLTVLDSAGYILGRVVLPPGDATTQLVLVARDHLAVRRRDSDGAVRLSFHRIRN